LDTAIKTQILTCQ